MNATATLAPISHNRRAAVLDITLPGGFILATITVGALMGGAFASDEKLRGWLLANAQSRVNFEAKIHGFTAPTVAWES